jgi:nucleoside-triphosphatase
MRKIILLTGRPGSGKTSLIRQVLEHYEGQADGFYTQEIREGGTRKGFEIITLDGQHAALAHVDIKSAQRLGKYHLDLDTLERLAVPALQSAVQSGALVVIDEIGPMELRSALFRQAVTQALESGSSVLGSIVQRSLPFSDEIKRRQDVRMVEVAPSNRDALVGQILTWLEHTEDTR